MVAQAAMRQEPMVVARLAKELAVDLKPVEDCLVELGREEMLVGM